MWHDLVPFDSSGGGSVYEPLYFAGTEYSVAITKMVSTILTVFCTVFIDCDCNADCVYG
ncbi:hypothetical protein ACI8B_30039 [Acinetobacter proteolyticus]|uniref:Uncharacterized protein n=1 Tax=Acinetobacter proteolyticus TaxID=1776741 RepID=A0A653K6Z1_9GAMM|nr:hypothetical protein ACI8B_30039 [Acinetobacter proteolyticus]